MMIQIARDAASRDTRDFIAAAGGADANPAFMSAVQKELTDLGSGIPARRAGVGHIPQRLPAGQSLDYETTLLRLVFERGESAYAIRWANGVIAMTEVPRFKLAADTAIQADPEGGLVGWHIVFNLRTTMTPRRKRSRVTSLTIHGPGGDVIAVAEDRE